VKLLNATVAHIGIAVPDLAEASAFYRDILGAEPRGLGQLDGATIVSFQLGEVEVELLHPESDDSPVGRFLARRGPGIHHICYRVPNLIETLARCRAQGYRLVDEAPRVGQGGNRVAFMHPKSTGGILIELTE